MWPKDWVCCVYRNQTSARVNGTGDKCVNSEVLLFKGIQQSKSESIPKVKTGRQRQTILNAETKSKVINPKQALRQEHKAWTKKRYRKLRRYAGTTRTNTEKANTFRKQTNDRIGTATGREHKPKHVRSSSWELWCKMGKSTGLWGPEVKEWS